MTATITFVDDSPVARINLNNPAKHNALGKAELLSIRQCLGEVEKSALIRVLIVSSTPAKTFCAGASLDELQTGAITSNDFQTMTDELAELSIPTICAINGDFFGGGAELALSCDFRFAMQGIKMRVPASTLGLCYPVAGIERYVERLSHSAVKRILVAAETLSDAQLLELGFIERILEPNEFEVTVNQYANNLCKLAPLAVHAMKKIINKKSQGVFCEEAETLALKCFESEDLKEGIAAKKEKRAPIFKGV